MAAQEVGRGVKVKRDDIKEENQHYQEQVSHELNSKDDSEDSEKEDL
jgi:hypothetical protein